MVVTHHPAPDLMTWPLYWNLSQRPCFMSPLNFSLLLLPVLQKPSSRNVILSGWFKYFFRVFSFNLLKGELSLLASSHRGLEVSSGPRPFLFCFCAFPLTSQRQVRPPSVLTACACDRGKKKSVPIEATAPVSKPESV